MKINDIFLLISFKFREMLSIMDNISIYKHLIHENRIINVFIAIYSQKKSLLDCYANEVDDRKKIITTQKKSLRNLPNWP